MYRKIFGSTLLFLRDKVFGVVIVFEWISSVLIGSLGSFGEEKIKYKDKVDNRDKYK